jgi:hypothetical protein
MGSGPGVERQSLNQNDELVADSGLFYFTLPGWGEGPRKHQACTGSAPRTSHPAVQQSAQSGGEVSPDLFQLQLARTVSSTLPCRLASEYPQWLFGGVLTRNFALVVTSKRDPPRSGQFDTLQCSGYLRVEETVSGPQGLAFRSCCRLGTCRR